MSRVIRDYSNFALPTGPWMNVKDFHARILDLRKGYPYTNQELFELLEYAIKRNPRGPNQELTLLKKVILSRMQEPPEVDARLVHES